MSFKDTVKERTPEQLKEEARNIMKVAKAKQKALLKKASDAKLKKLSEVGEKAIEFLNGNCELDDLKRVAVLGGLVEKNKGVDDE